MKKILIVVADYYKNVSTSLLASAKKKIPSIFVLFINPKYFFNSILFLQKKSLPMLPPKI